MNQELSFGTFVRQRRRELDLTQEELARRVGCAAITLRKIEADDLRASVQIAERLAMALAIPLEERSEFVRRARAVRPESAELPQVTPPPSMEEIGREDLTGRAIRGYALAERIGMGGMGSVYRAVQPNVDREVAVKIILPAFANHPDFIRRFEAEAQLVARLEHPHIVPLYDYWREPGVAYLVMRLLRGGNVQNLLSQGPLSIEMTTHMLEQICSALNAAHRIGVIHRDLKPANVLLDEDTNAYLADFGIAKNLGSPDLENQTQLDAIIGSPQYMSPEQIRSLSVRPQTDVYCLGVMLYEMLTGALPFAGPTPFDLIQQHINTPMPPLSAHQAGLPAALDTVIKRATAKDPDQRHADALSLFHDFRQAISGMTSVHPITILYEEEEANLEIGNPFKGLRAFAEADAENFFGRETLVQQLLARLGEGGELSRFLAVIGPSGSGKSSVVRAGLIPALRRGGLPGSENWFVVDMLPGKHPFEELEASLLRVAVNPPEHLLSQMKDGNRGLLRAVHRILPADDSVELVLVIDQFEEVFTLIEDEAERALLLESLAAAVLDERSRLRVIITLRADFTDKPLRYMDFGELMNRRFEFVLPLTADEVERAVAGPAQRVGLKLEKGLVSAIIRDTGNQPGALPLLQYALSELFEKRDGRTLTNKAYKEIGGVLGALGRSAETVYANLNEADQLAARQLFLRLVTLGEGTEDTRRRVLRDEIQALYGDQQSMIQRVINEFGKARLLSFDRDPITRGATIEVAHEALLREWTRLREWLNESRADVRIQRQLATAASEWQHADCDPSFLMTGSRLEQFEGWAANTTVALTQNERAFLDASITERNRRETEERTRQHRELEAAQKLAKTERARAEEQTYSANRLRTRNRVITTIGSIAVILALLAGTFGVQSNQNAARAESQARIAQARELVGYATNNLNTDAELSALLALQAVSKTTAADGGVLPEAESVLHRSVQALHSPLMTIHASPGHGFSGVQWSPDGTRIVSWLYDLNIPGGPPFAGTPILDGATGRVLYTLPGGPLAIYWTNDRIVTGNWSENIATLIRWDISSSQSERQLATVSMPLPSATEIPWSDVTLDFHYFIFVMGDGVTKVYDLTTGQETATTLTDNLPKYNGNPVFSRDGTRLAYRNLDSTISIVDTATWKEQVRLSGSHPGAEVPFTWSYDSKSLVRINRDGTVTVWNVTTGQEQYTVSTELHVTAALLSNDGTRLATATADGQIILWDTSTQQRVLTLAVGELAGLDINPDGTRLITTSSDGTLQVWDLLPNRELLTLVNGAPGETGTTGLGYSPDGRRLVVSSNGNTPIVWDTETGQKVFTLVGHTDLVQTAAWSPDGSLIASGGGDHTAILWDAKTGQALRKLDGHTDTIYSMAFSPDGTRLATSSPDHSVIIWDVKTGNPLLTLAQPDKSKGVAWSPDGLRLAAGTENGYIHIWDSLTGKQQLEITVGDNVGMIAFSPDGARLVAGMLNFHEARVFDAQTGEKLWTLGGNSDLVAGVAYSPDGKRIATAGKDGVIKLWDAATGQEQLTLYGPLEGFYRVIFSPDGTRLATSGPDGTTRIYVLPLDELVALAKSRLTRSLTVKECQQYLHVDQCPANP